MKGHSLRGLPSGNIILFHDALQFPIRDNAYSCDAFRVPREVGTYLTGGAVIAPGEKSPTSVDVNVLHCS